jgi:two-component system cell cycle sensor histidine kinase/response regulator CckA
MKPLKILIVDDLPLNRKLLTAQLEGEGHTVLQAAHGGEAMAMLEQTTVDLLISDILMPVMDGYRLCALVRASERHRDLPFIFYTATYTSPADEELCLQLGANKYLRKPIGVQQMTAAIQESLGLTPFRPPSNVQAEEILKEYSERLIFKLEQRNVELAAALEQLKQTEEQLRQFLDHSPAVLYALKIEGDKLVPRLVSENITRFLGVPQEEALRPEWWETHIHPDDRTRAEAGTAGALRDGVSRNEYRLQHRDGTYRWVDDTKRLVRDASGQPAELVGATTDITERRQIQDELRESERRFQSMLSNLELVAMTMDREARITYCNDYLLRLTGWTREELIGRDWFATFIPKEGLETMRATFAELLTDAPPAWHHENDLLTRSGKRLRIQWNNSVLRSLSGEVIGTASIGEDITERRNLEQQMLRTQRLEGLGTLASGIAHDLNNLLMPILMGASLLRRFEISPQSRKAIDNIELSVTRGRDLVKQVLLFARGAEVSREAVELPRIVGEIESIATSTFPRNIAFEISIPGDLRAVTGDTTQLTQVLLNLCVNARDAMPRGGVISISAANTDLSARSAQRSGGSTGGPYVLLEVADTGEGMPRELIDRIFDPFFTTKEAGKGTGLGLSTVQGIVSNHGGFVSVASTVGEGTTFKVYLPAHDHRSVAVKAENGTAAEPPRGNGETILVVDDDSTILSITAQTLEAFGYNAIVAEDGAQAIVIYSRRSADIALVLTDMSMPIIDGQALIAALTRLDPTLPIIAATGDTASAHLARIAKTGATVLTKPYTADHMLRTIADVLGARGKTTPR